jgi:peptidoglycan/xylan/chitin deacetylase (PgdA/CDA1 family)
MARFVRFAAALLALAPLACSSSEDSPSDVPLPSTIGSATPGAGGSGTTAPPPVTGAGGATGAAGSTSGDMMVGGVLQPGASLGGSASTPPPAAAEMGGTGGVTDPGTVVGPGLSGLPAPGAGGVPQPAGTPGNLRVLDWAGFTGAISYTFDDSNSSQINNYGVLNALGVPFTFYLQTGKTAESQNPIWAQAVLDGHELGNHTQSHQTTGDLGADTDRATQFIESRFGVTVFTMAAPNGFTGYSAVASTRFLINRGVRDQQIRPNDASDPFDLPCFIPRDDAPQSDIDAKTDAVRANRTWQTVLVHGFNGGTDGAFNSIDLDDFLGAVNYSKSFGDIWLDTLLEVAAYWRGQKTFTSVTPTTSGSDTTWTWTLPAHFPPGRFLRVTVDGGKLTQAGATLAWDDHGYYEIALDAGSVTLSP